MDTEKESQEIEKMKQRQELLANVNKLSLPSESTQQSTGISTSKGTISSAPSAVSTESLEHQDVPSTSDTLEKGDSKQVAPVAADQHETLTEDINLINNNTSQSTKDNVTSINTVKDKVREDHKEISSQSEDETSKSSSENSDSQTDSEYESGTAENDNYYFTENENDGEWTIGSNVVVDGEMKDNINEQNDHQTSTSINLKRKASKSPNSGEKRKKKKSKKKRSKTKK